MSYNFIVPIESDFTIDSVFNQLPNRVEILDGNIDFSKAWPNGVHYFFVNRESSRPIEIEKIERQVNIRIFSASSRFDYLLAINITKEVARIMNGLIESESHSRPLTIDEFESEYDEEWIKNHSKNVLSSVLDLNQKPNDTVIEIAGVFRKLTIGKRFKRELTIDQDNFEERFHRCLKKLNYIDNEDVYIAGINQLENEKGRFVRLSVLSDNCYTMLTDKKTLITLNTVDSKEEGPTLSFSTFADVAKEHSEWLDEIHLLVSPIERSEWEVLLNQAKRYHIDDMFSSEFSEESDSETKESTVELTENDYQVLTFSPVIVFCMIASSDGDVNQEELNSFQEILVVEIESQSLEIQKILLITMANFSYIIEYILTSEICLEDMLAYTVNIIDSKLPNDEAKNLKCLLSHYGRKFTEASGGVLGSKINKNQALSDIAAILGMHDITY